MKIRRTIVAMAMVGMMIATVFAIAADNPNKEAKPAKAVEKPKEISHTRTAQCLLRVSFDPSVLPLNEQMLGYLVTSSGILGKVTKEILNSETYPDVTLTEIGPNGGVEPVGEPGGMGGGMGGGMMGMGGFGGGGGATGMSGGGGMSMPVNPPDAPETPVAPEDPAAPSTGTAPSSSNGSVRNPTDAARNQEEKQLLEVQQRAAERRANDAQRQAEQLQAQIERSTGYGRQERVDMSPGPMGSKQDLLIRFELRLLDEHVPAATEAMEAIITLLSKALQRDFDQYNDRMARRVSMAQNQAADAEEQVRTFQDGLQKLSPSKELRRHSLMEEISTYRDQIRKNQMDDELNRAMTDNLSKQIAEAEKKAQIQMADDTVLRDLLNMLKISKERVEALEIMVASGQANQNSLQDAMEKLTRAGIELAQRKEQLGVSAGAERINDLLKRMSDISLQTTKIRIQLVRLEQWISEASQQLAKSVDYEMLSMRLELAKEKLRESLRRAASIRDYQPEPPVVETIGAN